MGNMQGKTGVLEQELHQTARQLGPNKGGRILLAAGDTASRVRGAVDAMRVAGIPLDINRVLAADTQLGNLSDEIRQLYDLANNILAVTERENISNRELQRELVTPFINEVRQSTDKLQISYSKFADKAHPMTPEIKADLEHSFKDILSAIKELSDRIEEKLVKEQLSESITIPLDNMTSIAKQFHDRPKKGIVRHTIHQLIGRSEAGNGKELLENLYILFCHTAGTALEMDQAGLIDYKSVLPVYGKTTEISLRDGAEKGFPAPRSIVENHENETIKNKN